uniref:Portal protein n=1 Tax=Salmonella phage vB_STmST19_KE13 TaxID=3161167 RepID=A0AAU8GGI8_9CAUD
MIVKIGDKWVVKSKDGSQQFGEYDTEEAAKKRLAEVEAFKHMNNKLQVNVLTTINSASNISEQIIDGDPHYVIKNVVPVVDDVVMNNGLYPGEEIRKSYHGLDGKPAPYNHPMIDGKYVSASMTRAANQFSVGAWIENSSHDGSKALVDLKVNKVIAERSEKGQELLSRIEALMNSAEDAEPIHVSTGLLLNREAAEGTSKGKKYTWIARNMEWDHLAILPPGVPGAGTPEDGVGIFATNGEQIERITVNLEDSTVPDESANKINYKSWLHKAINYITNKSELSFENISEQIRQTLKAEVGEDVWPYIVAVYDDRVGFEIKGQIFQQFYIVEDDVVKLVGERVKAVYKTELEPVKSTEGEISMTNEELQAVLADALKPVQESLTAVNQKLTDIEAENVKLKEQLQANTEQEETAMRAAIIAELKLPESAVNALKGEALRETYALTSKPAALKGGFQPNHADDDFDMEAPE